jgi:BMFP domain-containing protein YqiC
MKGFVAHVEDLAENPSTSDKQVSLKKRERAEFLRSRIKELNRRLARLNKARKHRDTH